MKKPTKHLAYKPPGGTLTRVTGLFVNEDSGFLSVRMRDGVTIPAGSYLYLFDEGDTDAESND